MNYLWSCCCFWHCYIMKSECRFYFSFSFSLSFCLPLPTQTPHPLFPLLHSQENDWLLAEISVRSSSSCLFSGLISISYVYACVYIYIFIFLYYYYYFVWVALAVARVILIAIRLTVAPWENECSTRKAAQRRQFDFNWLLSSLLFI